MTFRISKKCYAEWGKEEPDRIIPSRKLKTLPKMNFIFLVERLHTKWLSHNQYRRNKKYSKSIKLTLNGSGFAKILMFFHIFLIFFKVREFTFKILTHLNIP